MYKVRNVYENAVIAEFESLDDAINCIMFHIDQDREDDEYEPGKYTIDD